MLTACTVGYVKLQECKLFSLKLLEDYGDGHTDVLSLTIVLERKQTHDKDPKRHLLIFKPINQTLLGKQRNS